jgi:hypothetical protein
MSPFSIFATGRADALFRCGFLRFAGLPPRHAFRR